MKWRIIEVPQGEETESDLTSGELVGVSVLLAHNPSVNDDNVYIRAYRKLQSVVNRAIEDE